MAKKNCHLLHSLGGSTSYGMLSWKAKILWPMMIADADDQGRHNTLAKPIKWTVCQNVDEIAIDEIPDLLAEMAEQEMILLYGENNCYGQILNWWDHQPMSYARPSDYPPPDGWVDRVRYRKGEDVIKQHWDCPGGFDPCSCQPYGNDAPKDTPTDGGYDGSYEAPKTTEQKTTEREKKQKATDNNRKKDAAAVADLSIDIFTRMECLGIAMPVVRELATLEHVTPEYLEGWRLWLHNGGGENLKNPPGYIVTQIREGNEPP
jgi:hypothetical protein